MPKSEFARDLKTSRAQIDRLLDVENTSINLKTLASIAATTGKSDRVEDGFLHHEILEKRLNDYTKIK